MALRQVSRAMCEDVSAFFAGRNSFATVLAYKSDFDFFQTSLGWSWGYLKRVHLELRPGDQRYLRVAGGVHGTSWRMWAGFCQLAREKMPHLTAFSLKCKIKIPEVASRLFTNVQGFPLLSSCAFHLNTIPNDDVLDMVKRVSWRLTGNIWRGPFPFLRLPKEVQLHVLEYLLTTQSDPYVRRWADAYGNEMQSSQGVITLQNRRHQRVNEDSPLTCCGTCSHMQAMCFCSTRQCSFSTTCTCFTSPLPYFLVSREFHHMTAHMFYARNLFAFVDEDPDAMLRTIVNIPTPTLLQIRLLAFVFPSLFRSSTRPAHRAEDIALLSWAVMRRFIREHFTLDLLTICVMDFGSRNHFPAGFLNRRRYLRRVLLAFAELPNLRDFWLYLVDDRGFEEEARRVVLGARVLREQTFLRRITVAGHP